MRSLVGLWSCLALVYLPLWACGDSSTAEQSDAGVDASALDRPQPGEDFGRDVLEYSLRLDLDQGSGSVTVEIAGSSSQALSLELGSVEIESVADDDGPLHYSVSGAQLDIGVPSSTTPRKLTIEYSFEPKSDFDGWMSDKGVTFLWPYFCKNLFPCKSDPADGARFTIEVIGDTADNAVYPASIPADAPSYMPAIAVGDYTREVLGTTAAGTEVAVHYLPGEELDATEGTVHLLEVFDFLETTYGPYIYGDAVATVSANWGGGDFGGMEHHPFWHVSSGSLYNEEVHAHEAAHGWYGNGVRIACWEDFVLSEGVVTYMAARALAQSGVDLWPDYECELKSICSGAGNTVALPTGCGNIDLLNHPLWSGVPYQKGAFFFKAVAESMSPEALDQALADFYEDHVGTAAHMQDLIDLLAERGDAEAIQALAQSWLREETCPVSTATLCL